jgi:tetratricopeptide (TPR) repeat protein
MSEGYEVLQRKMGAHSGQFRLLFVMIACSWCCLPGSLHAINPPTPADDQACSDAYNSGLKADASGAIAKITAVIQRNTRSWLCFHLRAGLYNQQGDLDQAFLDVNRAVDLAPKREANPYVLRAALDLETQRWDKLLADSEAALARDHKNAWCLAYRGLGLHGVGRYSEAVAALDEALKPRNQLPDSVRQAAYEWRGYPLLMLNRNAEAIDSFDKAVALGATDIPLYIFRGIAEWKLGQLDKAKADAAILLQRDPRLQASFGGDHLLEMFDLEKRGAATMKAIEAAQTAEAKGDWPASFEAWNTAYSDCTIFMADGQAICNVKIPDGLFRIYPKLAVKPAMPELARQYQVQAETYFREKDFAKTTEAYGKLIGVAPWFPQAYFNRGFLEGEQQQQYKAAIADMQTYLKLAPNAADARNAQDQIYVWQAKAK